MIKSVTIKILFLLMMSAALPSLGQFTDDFDATGNDPGWGVATGDGSAVIDFERHDGYSTITVDATSDKLNIWWAIIRLPVPGLDMNKLIQPEYELRVEAKIKTSHAPRRVNLHFNHSRTTDFHSHLKEYDIGDTSNWHVISMTTNNFEVQEDDQVNVQMALMDWGQEIYTIDIDYIKVDVVNKHEVAPDMGNPQDYHPSVPNPDDLHEKISIEEDAVLDKSFPERNFNNWQDPFTPVQKLLAVNQNQLIVMRSDFSKYKNAAPNGWGVLKMHLHHMEHSPDFEKDFGMVRLVEIVGGPENWQDEMITHKQFVSAKSPVFNGQMIIDVDPAESAKRTIHFPLSEAVLKRLFSGKTKGLALMSLGAITASFYASETANDTLRPVIHFNTR